MRTRIGGLGPGRPCSSSTSPRYPVLWHGPPPEPVTTPPRRPGSTWPAHKNAMTPSQNSLYFREWGRVRAACKQQGFPVPDRRFLHIKALGQDKSHLDFTNADFDLVLAEIGRESCRER